MGPENLYGEKEVNVFDLNQTGDGPRKHDVVIRSDRDGRVLETKTYELWRIKGTVMPIDHGIKFLKDASFKVETMTGIPLTPLRESQTNNNAVKLADDEVVATYTELTEEALYKRCKVMAGSEELDGNSGRDAMIQFMRRRRGMQISEGRDPGAEALASKGIGEAMSADETAQLLGNSDYVESTNKSSEAAELARSASRQQRRAAPLDALTA